MYKLVREIDIEHKVGDRYISERIVLPGRDVYQDIVALYAHNLLALYNEEQEWVLVDDSGTGIPIMYTPPISIVHNYLIKDLGYSVGFAKELIMQVPPPYL